jgi:NADH:ubiquinone oxidoreductase subunit K
MNLDFLLILFFQEYIFIILIVFCLGILSCFLQRKNIIDSLHAIEKYFELVTQAKKETT